MIRNVSFVSLLTVLTINQAQVVLAQDSYQLNAQAALETLQTWYNGTTGLWNTAGWWNSANCIAVLADLTSVNPSADNITGDVFSKTFDSAQSYNLQELRIDSTNRCAWPDCPQKPPVVQPKGFLNDYYDDEGWWALAWIKVYDLTKQPQYLQAASDIFDDMVAGYNATCGGIWWDKKHSYDSAIANELFLSVAAHLANRKPNKAYYVDWAVRQWHWFDSVGLINSVHNINDGLDMTTCKNNGGIVWSYNQGVVLGALVELNAAAPNGEYLTAAMSIAQAAIEKLSDSNGILHDQGEPNLGADGSQFKGIFMRNLQLLQQATNDLDLKMYIQKNAAWIWRYDRDAPTDHTGPVWSGPFYNATAATQSSALDALVAAAAVSR